MSITQDQLDSAKHNLDQIIGLLGLEAESTAVDDESQIKLVLKSDDAGRIIGRKGRTLGAIQLLINSMMRKNFEESSRVLVVFEGYEERQREKRENSPREDKDKRRGGRNDRRPRRDSGKSDRREKRDDRDDRDDRNDRNNRNNRDNRSEAKERSPKAEKRNDKKRSRPKEDQSVYADVTEPEDFEQKSEKSHEERPKKVDPHEKIQMQAKDALKEVRRWGEEVVLPVMSTEERGIVRDILKTESDIELDEDKSNRRLVIRLK